MNLFGDEYPPFDPENNAEDASFLLQVRDAHIQILLEWLNAIAIWQIAAVVICSAWLVLPMFLLDNEPRPRIVQWSYPASAATSKYIATKYRKFFFLKPLKWVSRTRILHDWYVKSISEYAGARGTSAAKLMLVCTSMCGSLQIVLAIGMNISQLCSTVRMWTLVAGGVCCVMMGAAESALLWDAGDERRQRHVEMDRLRVARAQIDLARRASQNVVSVAPNGHLPPRHPSMSVNAKVLGRKQSEIMLQPSPQGSEKLNQVAASRATSDFNVLPPTGSTLRHRGDRHGRPRVSRRMNSRYEDSRYTTIPSDSDDTDSESLSGSESDTIEDAQLSAVSDSVHSDQDIEATDRQHAAAADAQTNTAASSSTNGHSSNNGLQLDTAPVVNRSERSKSSGHLQLPTISTGSPTSDDQWVQMKQEMAKNGQANGFEHRTEDDSPAVDFDGEPNFLSLYRATTEPGSVIDDSEKTRRVIFHMAGALILVFANFIAECFMDGGALRRPWGAISATIGFLVFFGFSIMQWLSGNYDEGVPKCLHTKNWAPDWLHRAFNCPQGARDWHQGNLLLLLNGNKPPSLSFVGKVFILWELLAFGLLMICVPLELMWHNKLVHDPSSEMFEQSIVWRPEDRNLVGMLSRQQATRVAQYVISKTTQRQ